MTKEFLSIREAAELLGVSKSTIYQMLNHGLPHTRAFEGSQKIILFTEDLREFLNARKVTLGDETNNNDNSLDFRSAYRI